MADQGSRRNGDLSPCRSRLTPAGTSGLSPAGAPASAWLAVATMLAPRWGLGWFALLLGIVLAVMMVRYVAVPVGIVGMRTAKPAKTPQSGQAAKLAGTAVTGLFSAVLVRRRMPSPGAASGCSAAARCSRSGWRCWSSA
jgi:hypothetical protein